MKYNVGDKVKIREDLEIGDTYNDCTFIKNMEKYKGSIATITYSYEDDSYDIDLDDGNWFWTDEMFEDIKENEYSFGGKVKVDVGYHLDYCGHRVLKNVIDDDVPTIQKVHVYVGEDGTQYVLPTDAIDFVIPHEVD